MAEYIESEALTIENLEKYMTVMEVNTKEYGQQVVVAVDDLMYLPTADVEEVLKCKNCKNYELMKSNNSHFCNKFGGYVTEDDFCSRGARKDGVTDTNVSGKLKEGIEE